jgi:hypothetical protein
MVVRCSLLFQDIQVLGGKTFYRQLPNQSSPERL